MAMLPKIRSRYIGLHLALLDVSEIPVLLVEEWQSILSMALLEGIWSLIDHTHSFEYRSHSVLKSCFPIGPFIPGLQCDPVHQ